MSNQLTDITGNLFNVLLNFENKGAQAPTDHPLLSFSGLFNLPPNVLATLQNPLNQAFDQIWAVNTDSNGQTMLNRTQTVITSQISSAVHGIGSSYSAYNIGVNLPQTGRLLAIVESQPGLVAQNASQVVTLSYQLNGISANFTVTTPVTGGLIGDPTYSLTFDIMITIVIILPPFPGALVTTASFSIGNANISASNLIAEIGDAILTVINFLTNQPTNIFQAAEGSIDSAGGSANLGQLGALITQFGSAWQQAATSIGFTQLFAFIDGQPSLNFRFIHPLDPAPTVVNAAIPQYPSLFHPLLGTSASVVQAGSPLGVTGSSFPVGQASALYIAWNDTTSGTVLESDINWGPANGPAQPVSLPRNGADGANTFSVTNLAPNSPFTFSVRDQDLITETPFSTPLTLTTQATNQIDLLIGGQNVGSAILTASGVFNTIAAIPPNLTPGVYNLDAALAGNVLASIPIQVIAANQPLPPQIEVIDPSTNVVRGSVEATYTFTLRGQGFQPGAVAVTIDTDTGQTLGVATGDGAGRFQADFIWPTGFTTIHAIVAKEIVGGQTYEATVNVYGNALPQ